jgi:hypothetical protein
MALQARRNRQNMAHRSMKGALQQAREARNRRCVIEKVTSIQVM